MAECPCPHRRRTERAPAGSPGPSWSRSRPSAGYCSKASSAHSRRLAAATVAGSQHRPHCCCCCCWLSSSPDWCCCCCCSARPSLLLALLTSPTNASPTAAGRTAASCRCILLQCCCRHLAPRASQPGAFHKRGPAEWLPSGASSSTAAGAQAPALPYIAAAPARQRRLKLGQALPQCCWVGCCCHGRCPMLVTELP